MNGRCPVAKLAEKWRSDADLLRRYGDDQGATVCELHAGEREAAWREWWSDELPLDDKAGDRHLPELLR